MIRAGNPRIDDFPPFRDGRAAVIYRINLQRAAGLTNSDLQQPSNAFVLALRSKVAAPLISPIVSWAAAIPGLPK